MKRISKRDYYKYSKKCEPKQVELWKDLYRPSIEIEQLIESGKDVTLKIVGNVKVDSLLDGRQMVLFLKENWNIWKE